MKDAAKRRGARWDPEERSWYVPGGTNLLPFMQWYRPKKAPTTPSHPPYVFVRCPHGHQHEMAYELGMRLGGQLPLCPFDQARPYPPPGTLEDDDDE